MDMFMLPNLLTVQIEAKCRQDEQQTLEIKVRETWGGKVKARRNQQLPKSVSEEELEREIYVLDYVSRRSRR
jgi:hypothetical protein